MNKKRTVTALSIVLTLVSVLMLFAPLALAAEQKASDEHTMLKVTANTYLSSAQNTSKKNRLMYLPKGTLVNMVEAGSKYYTVSIAGQQGYVQKKNLRSSWGYGTVGTIKIAGTKINYYTTIGNDNAYYMAYNEKDKKSKNGAIYFDFRNMDTSRRQNLILYGHNMKNGSMFAALHKYKDAAFLQANNTITLGFNSMYSFAGGYRDYKIFAAGVLNTETDPNFWRTEFKSVSELKAYAKSMYDMCKGKEDATVMEGFASGNVNEMITLITCTSPSDTTGRYVVFAYR